MLRVLYALKNPVKEILSLISSYKTDIFSPDMSITKVISENYYDIVFLEGELNSFVEIKTVDPRVEVILFGNHETDAVEAVRMGVFAWFPLPVDSLERLQETVDSISDIVRTRSETAELEKQLSSKYTFAGIVGKNPGMVDIFGFVRRISPYFKTATIMGETGTGKETIAKSLHSLSPVAKHPFLSINCGALGANLIESELFGHKKGSFTGAIADKTGLFEAAGEGTILLDEIGELPLAVQPHLLRVLQDGEVRPIGSNRSFRAKCRVIATTNRNLAEEVKKGHFREDLFYRLTPLTITVPPLRERKDDLPLLCRHFLFHFSNRTGKKVLGISMPAQSALFAYDWPGNVRMLESVLEHAAILTKASFIRLEDLPSYVFNGSYEQRTIASELSLDDVIKAHIERVLWESDGNRSKTARKLNIKRNALLRKIKKYSIR
ncbi:MAG TPA: sigma-54 dependent transcriptional regulator [Thermodesulfovibrionales bacterium]|nr:sigma-54 dependent transcriptional regulator [Thermodesulfovibrionales bacterium]